MFRWGEEFGKVSVDGGGLVGWLEGREVRGFG